MLDKLCPPAILYLGFCLTQIIIDTFKGFYNVAFFKMIVMIIFTLLLNILCKRGLSIISWLVVFIPFILMTYITAVLMFVFGLNPKSSNFDGQVKYPNDYPEELFIIRNPNIYTYPGYKQPTPSTFSNPADNSSNNNQSNYKHTTDKNSVVNENTSNNSVSTDKTSVESSNNKIKNNNSLKSYEVSFNERESHIN